MHHTEVNVSMSALLRCTVSVPLEAPPHSWMLSFSSFSQEYFLGFQTLARPCICCQEKSSHLVLEADISKGWGSCNEQSCHASCCNLCNLIWLLLLLLQRQYILQACLRAKEMHQAFPGQLLLCPAHWVLSRRVVQCYKIAAQNSSYLNLQIISMAQ